MAFSKQFEKGLYKLFRERTHWLRSKVGLKRPGKPSRFTQKKVSRGIKNLQLLASQAFSHKLAKSAFEDHVSATKTWHVKGHGRPEKIKLFKQWFRLTFGSTRRGYVYSFWNKNKCIYVGRTGRGGGRPSDHFNVFWFSQVAFVKIFRVKGKSQVPKVECLAIHRFQPTYNSNVAATKKWTKACPLCEIHKAIESELRDIFRFR